MDNTPIWDDGHRPSFPALEGDTTTDVCVVGLGGSGLACIDELLSREVSCIGIDAGTVACGAAGRNAGFLLAGYSTFHHRLAQEHGHEFAARVYHLTLEEIDRMAAWTPAEVRRTGSLRIAADAEETADCNAQLAAMRRDHLPVEVYEGPEGAGLLFPRDAACNPMARCRAAAMDVARGGARLHENTPAIRLGPGAVDTPRGRIRCRFVLVLVDGGLGRLLRADHDRLFSVRLQMLGTSEDASVSFPRPVYRRYGYDYWQQLPDGRLAVGGLRDRFRQEEQTDSSEPTDGVQSGVEAMLRETLRSNAPVTHRWGATVSYTPSGLPHVAQIDRGIWAAGGYSGTGNVVGALFGRALARLAATGDQASLDPLLPG